MKAKDKKAQIILEGKLKQLYETIRDHKDPKSGRQVSMIFMKLPSKSVSEIQNLLNLLKIKYLARNQNCYKTTTTTISFSHVVLIFS